MRLRAQLALWRTRLRFRRRRWHYWDKRHNAAEIKKWQKLADEAQGETKRLEKALGATPAPKPPTTKPKPAPKAPPKPKNIIMFDSTEVGTIPANAEAVAGYVGGNWPTYNELVKRFPHAHHLSIAINARENAMCLDVEAGDASPSQVVNWVKRQWGKGVKRPCLYASLEPMEEIKAKLNAAGIHRDQYRLWSAHYTYKPHIEPGTDATQWTDKALGRNLDQSLCSPTFFN